MPKISNDVLKMGLLKGLGYCCLIIFGLGIFSILLGIYGLILAINAKAVVPPMSSFIPFILGQLLVVLLFFVGGVYLCARAKEKWAMRIKKKFGKVKWSSYE